MANTKIAKITVTLMGILIILFSIVFQITMNIMSDNMGVMIAIYIVFIIIIYRFFDGYKVKDNKEYSEKNKLLVMFSMIMELIVLIGFIVEIRFKGIATFELCVQTAIVLISYILNMIVFFNNEMSKKLKYMVLIELIIIYASTITIESNWVFFVCIPMIAVCTIFGEDKILKISGIILNIITMILSIYKVTVMDESENPALYGGIYMTIFAIYIVFVICIVNTSKLIGSINEKKYNEMLDKQNDVKKLSDKVIYESKEIKEDASKTNSIVDELERTSNMSSIIFENIAEKNSEKSNNVIVQTNMTSKIKSMIKDVKLDVNEAFNSTKSSLEGLVSSRNSIENIKDKSSNIINSNKEVIVAFEELTNNIKNIKNTIGAIENISEQTNMLSLNAFIESSRAEEKKGEFDVVASQIRNLSDETYELTSEMNKIIMNLENKTATARKAINSVMNSVNDENQTIELTVQDLKNMDNDIKCLGNNISSISSKVDKVEEYSKKIEEKSKKVAESSNIVIEKTKNAAYLNKKNQEKTVKTRELLDDLVKTVSELDKFI